MYLEYILLGLFLFFLMRIVFKRQSGHGLLLPSFIVIASGYYLFIETVTVNIGVSVVCVIFAILFRKVYHSSANAG